MMKSRVSQWSVRIRGVLLDSIRPKEFAVAICVDDVKGRGSVAHRSRTPDLSFRRAGANIYDKICHKLKGVGMYGTMLIRLPVGPETNEASLSW